MGAFDVILLAVDKSEQSDAAVLIARELAQLGKGRVQLLHVRERDVVHGKCGGAWDLETQEEAEALLAKEADVLRAGDVVVTPQVVRAAHEHTAEVIVNAADKAEADVIVMGTRGLSVFGALMLGSTAYKVLHSTKRPVLVVP